MKSFINKARFSWILITVFCIALAVNAAIAFKSGLAKPMVSDAQLFLHIAQSLAEGDGYRLRDGFWPDTPTLSRAPGWPFAISLALWALPSAPPDMVMRCMAILLNCFVAVLVALLAKRVMGYPLSVIRASAGVDNQCMTPTTNNQQLTTNNHLPLLAGLIYVMHPVALHEAYEGMSEILFLVLTLSGTLILLPLPGGERVGVRVVLAPLGMLLLGLSCLVRPNFILWIVFAAVLVVARWVLGNVRKHAQFFRESPSGQDSTTEQPNNTTTGKRLALGALAMVLFLAPSALWAVRNYHACGHFPVLSTLRGQTFYGGNNEVVMHNPEYWGFWVFPNQIPGETSMWELSRTLSEYEVDQYYFGKGKQYALEHWREMPGLMLGKLVRAYVPVPWKISWGSLGVSAFRWVLYGLVAMGLWRYRHRLDPRYAVILAAMVLTNLTMVLAFYGYSRFAFEVEPFAIPIAACVVMKGWGWKDL